MSEIDKKNITSPESKSGTTDPIETYRDDLYKERKDTIGSYLSKITRGEEELEKKNTYPIEYDSNTVEEISVIDSSTGNPAPITNPPADQKAFQNDPNIEEAIQYFKSLSEGKQENFGGTFENVRDIFDKNNQEDGHGILNDPRIGASISNALKVNRWTPITTASLDEEKRFPDMNTSQYNVNLDQEIDSKKLLGADYDKLRRVGRSLLLAASSDSSEPNDETTNIKTREENFNLGEFDLGSFIASNIPGVGDESKIDGSVATATERVDVSKLDARNQGIEEGEITELEERVIEYSRYSYGTLNNHIRTFEDKPGSVEMLALSFQSLASMLAMSIGTYIVIEAISAGAKAITDLYRPNPGKALGTRDPQYIKHMTGKREFSNIGNEFLTILGNLPNAFMEYLDIYKPLHVTGVSGYLVYGQAVAFGIASLTYAMIKDFGFSSGFFAIMGRSVLRGESVREEIFGLGMGEESIGGPSFPALIGYFKNLKESRSLKALNYLAKTGDIFYASYNSSDSYAWKGLEERHKLQYSDESRVFPQKNGGTLNWSQSSALHVLLSRQASVRGAFTYAGLQGDIVARAGKPMKEDGIIGVKIKDDKNPDGIEVPSVEESRFSIETVKKLEEKLNAEYMPFYFQDLRTNEIISFHAFLTSLSDGFQPNFQAVKGYGRMDAAQIYSDTSRTISFNFIVYATSRSDLDVMYDKIDKMVTMVYPQWSYGTRVESADQRNKFTIPYSQIPTASPLLRVRIGDLIKSNRTFESVMGLFGVNDPNGFRVGDYNLDSEYGRWRAKRDIHNQREFKKWYQLQLEEPNKPEKGFKHRIENPAPPSNQPNPPQYRQLKYPNPEDKVQVHIFWRSDAIAEDANRNTSELTALDTTANLARYGSPGNPITVFMNPGKVKIPNSPSDFDNATTAPRYKSYGPIDGTPGLSAHYGDWVCSRMGLNHNEANSQKEEENLKNYMAVLPIETINYTGAPEDTDNPFNTWVLNENGERDQQKAEIASNKIKADKIFMVIRKQDMPQIPDDSFTAPQWNTDNPKPDEDSVLQNKAADFKKFFSSTHNPIIKAMNSTAGTGMPGVITQLGLDWKFGEYAWELDKGSRKPMGCEISISFAPIHEITPGLDSTGANRAPVFQANPTTTIGYSENE